MIQVTQMVITIPAPGTSQECAKCGHTHPDNRISQALFVCQNPACGHIANADENASEVIKIRGVRALLAGTIVIKTRKKTGSRIRRKKSDVPKVSIHITPAGTRESACGELVRRPPENNTPVGADLLRREASSIGEPVNPAMVAGENTGVRENLAGYQIRLFS